MWGKQTDDIQRVVIAKSPIEALSIAQLEIEAQSKHPQPRTMYLAVDSPKSLPHEFLQTIPIVVVAHDNDKSGDSTACAILELLPQAQKVRPKAKDWNLELLERNRQKEQKRIPDLELERD